MYMTTHPVQFVFDRPNDCHYTDNLLRFGPEMFLWHLLQDSRRADLVLSITIQKCSLQLRIFDTASEALMGQPLTKIFGSPKPVVTHEILHNRKISVSIRPVASDFLTWLARAAAINSRRKIALLVSCDAVAALKMTGDFDELPKNCMTLVRLPADAEALTRFLLKDSALRDTFPQLGDALERNRTPLMSALRMTVGDQMVCLHDRPEDFENMLLLHAVRDSSVTDAPTQLVDQAHYLHLLRRHRRLYLLSSRFNSLSVRLPDLTELEQQLHELHGALRTHTAELCRKYPDFPIEKALQFKGLIPSSSLSDTCADRDSAIVFCDSLASGIFALQKALQSDQIPPEVLESADISKFPDLYTLWNKPRNTLVLEAANFFCDRACAAVSKQRWDELSTSLYMLRFCCDQICASADQEDNLNNVLKLGEEILDLSNYISTSGWISGMLSDSAVQFASGVSNIAAYTQHLHNAAAREDLNQDQISLITKRLLLQEKVKAFYKPDLSVEQLAGDLKQAQQIYEAALSKPRPRPSGSAAGAVTKADAPPPAVKPPASPAVKPLSDAAPRQTTYEEDIRITRKLLYQSNMPGGVNYAEDEDDYDENIIVEDPT